MKSQAASRARNCNPNASEPKPGFEPEHATVRCHICPHVVNLAWVSTGGCVVDSTTQFYSAASEVLCSTLGTAGRIGRCQFAVDVRSTGRWPVTPHGYGIQFGFFFLLARVQPV
jgi:hypothetical protein